MPNGGGGLEKFGLRAVLDMEQFNKGVRQFTSAVDRFNKQTTGMEEQSTKTGTAMSTVLGGAIGGIAMSITTKLLGALQQAVSGLVDFMKESILVAARAEEMAIVVDFVSESFGRSKTEAQDAVQALMAAGATMATAQKTVVAFARYNLDAAQAVDLLKVAQASAIMTGADSSEMLDRLMWGITTYNKRILRTAGLNIDIKGSFEEFGDEISEAQKVQATFNDVLKEGAPLLGLYDAAMESPAKQLRSMPRDVNNLMRALGAPFQDAFGDAVKAVRGLVSALGESASEGGKLHGILVKLSEAAETAILLVTWESQVTEMLEKRQAVISDTAKSYDEYIESMIRAEMASHRMSERVGEALLQYDATSLNIRHQIALQNANTEAVKWLTEAQWEWIESAKGYGGEVDSVVMAYKRWQIESERVAEHIDLLAGSTHRGGSSFIQSSDDVRAWQQALEDATKASLEAIEESTKLAQSLTKVSEATVAAAAIEHLRAAVMAGTMSEQEFAVALQEVQLALGLVTPESLLLAQRINTITQAFELGMISLPVYTDMLKGLSIETQQASSSVQDMGRAVADTAMNMFDIFITKADDATAELERMEVESQHLAEEQRRLAEEIFNAAAAVGDDFVLALGDAAEETDIFNILLFEAADAAGANIDTLAALAGELGIYTEAEILAALATVATRAAIQELGVAIAQGTMTMADAVAALQELIATLPAGVDITQRADVAVRTYAGGLDDAARAEREAQRAAEQLARELERLASLTGDYFIDALDDAGDHLDHWNMLLLEMADAAGADAEELAALARALDLYDEEQIEAALNAAAMQAKIAELAREIAAGMGLDEAMAKLAQWREQLGFPVTTGPEETIDVAAEVQALIQEYNRLLRGGATEDILAAILAQINALEMSMVQVPAAIPTMAAGGTTNNAMNVNMGPVSVNNGMDMATFEARVRTVIRQEIGWR